VSSDCSSPTTPLAQHRNAKLNQRFNEALLNAPLADIHTPHGSRAYPLAIVSNAPPSESPSLASATTIGRSQLASESPFLSLATTIGGFDLASDSPSFASTTAIGHADQQDLHSPSFDSAAISTLVTSSGATSS